MKFRATGLYWTLVAGADLRLADCPQVVIPVWFSSDELEYQRPSATRISLRIHQHGWALTVFLVAVVRSAIQQMPMRLGGGGWICTNSPEGTDLQSAATRCLRRASNRQVTTPIGKVAPAAVVTRHLRLGVVAISIIQEHCMAKKTPAEDRGKTPAAANWRARMWGPATPEEEIYSKGE